MRIIQNTTGVTHVAYSRHFSYTGVALYESLVNGDNKYKSLAGQLNGLTSLPSPGSTKPLFYPAAANAAIASMLRFFYAANQVNVQRIDSLENAYKQKYAADAGHAFDMEEAALFGKNIASSVIEWSKKDNSGQAAISYTAQGYGYWEPTAPAFAAPAVPGWGNNKTMLAQSLVNSTPASPAAFSTTMGSSFYNMANELYEVSLSLTQDQKDIANFWDDAPNGKYYTAFGHWYSILKQILVTEKSSLMKGAEAYLRLGLTMNDASIGCWKSKYSFHQMRPITYIRKHMGKTEWNPLLTTPPHPEYTAAHATISSAAAYSLETVFGKNYSFTDHSYDGIGMQPRSFTSLEAAGDNAGISRLYGGIHYRPSIDAGKIQGVKIATNISNQLSLKR